MQTNDTVCNQDTLSPSTAPSTPEPAPCAVDPADPATERQRRAEAFERHVSEMQALSPEELVPINVDMFTALAMVAAALPRLRRMRSRIAALAELDISHIDALDDLRMATAYAHQNYLSASAPVESLPASYQRALTLRDTFLLDAKALVQRGFLDGALVAPFKGMTGYRNVANDLLGLAGLFGNHWPTIETHTGVRREELDEAAVLYDQLTAGVGEHQLAPTRVAAASNMRQRAFTLLVRSYDQARRAVSYLEWDAGDAEQIAPSIYTGRAHAKPASGSETPAGATAAAKTSAAATSDETSSNAATTPVTKAFTRAPIVPHIEPNDIPIGMAGSSPYLAT